MFVSFEAIYMLAYFLELIKLAFSTMQIYNVALPGKWAENIDESSSNTQMLYN